METTNMTDQPSERRLMCYRITEESLLTFIRRMDEWPEYLTVVKDLKEVRDEINTQIYDLENRWQKA